MFGIFPFPNKDASLWPQESKKQLIARCLMTKHCFAVFPGKNRGFIHKN